VRNLKFRARLFAGAGSGSSARIEPKSFRNFKILRFEFDAPQFIFTLIYRLLFLFF